MDSSSFVHHSTLRFMLSYTTEIGSCPEKSLKLYTVPLLSIKLADEEDG